MLLKDDEGKIWKTGLKLDYNPKVINLEQHKDLSHNIQLMATGRKHHVLVNEHNQLFIWGNVIKEKSSTYVDGFNLYYGDSLFNEEKIVSLSMKYGLFGAITVNKN